jgi:hypothetical protein
MVQLNEDKIQWKRYSSASRSFVKLIASDGNRNFPRSPSETSRRLVVTVALYGVVTCPQFANEFPAVRLCESFLRARCTRRICLFVPRRGNETKRLNSHVVGAWLKNHGSVHGADDALFAPCRRGWRSSRWRRWVFVPRLSTWSSEDAEIEIFRLRTTSCETLIQFRISQYWLIVPSFMAKCRLVHGRVGSRIPNNLVYSKTFFKASCLFWHKQFQIMRILYL